MSDSPNDSKMPALDGSQPPVAPQYPDAIAAGMQARMEAGGDVDDYVTPPPQNPPTINVKFSAGTGKSSTLVSVGEKRKYYTTPGSDESRSTEASFDSTNQGTDADFATTTSAGPPTTAYIFVPRGELARLQMAVDLLRKDVQDGTKEIRDEQGRNAGITHDMLDGIKGAVETSEENATKREAKASKERGEIKEAVGTLAGDISDKFAENSKLDNERHLQTMVAAADIFKEAKSGSTPSKAAATLAAETPRTLSTPSKAAATLAAETPLGHRGVDPVIKEFVIQLLSENPNISDEELARRYKAYKAIQDAEGNAKLAIQFPMENSPDDEEIQEPPMPDEIKGSKLANSWIVQVTVADRASYSNRAAKKAKGETVSEVESNGERELLGVRKALPRLQILNKYHDNALHSSMRKMKGRWIVYFTDFYANPKTASHRATIYQLSKSKTAQAAYDEFCVKNKIVGFAPWVKN